MTFELDIGRKRYSGQNICGEVVCLRYVSKFTMYI